MKIRINEVEGKIKDLLDVTVESFEMADKVINMLAINAPTSGYDKTDFYINLEDGTEYKGRLDLQQQYIDKENILQEHITSYTTYYINEWAKTLEEKTEAITTLSKILNNK
jgi:hypothetical protein